jgi:hypothetical protein
VTGAGDTVSAALGCGIAAGLSLREATALANLAAGVVVGKLGTATASLDELYAAMDAHSPVARGRMAVEALISAAQRARAAGERIAVIVGPVGAPGAALLARLEQAGRQADRVLLVEPADTDADALAVLAALRQVDWVVQVDLAGHAICWPGSGPTCCCPRAHDHGHLDHQRPHPGLARHAPGGPRRDPRRVQQLLRPGRRHVPLQPAQPGADPQVPAEFGLKSIINLRGAHGYGSYALERKPASSSALRSTTSSCTRARRRRSRRCTPWTSSSRPSNTPRCCTASPAPTGPAWARPVPHPAPGPPGRGRHGRARLEVRPLQARQDRRAGFLLRHLRGPQRQSPIGFLEWVNTEYNRLELHNRFRAEGWASLIVDKVLHRE